MPVDNELYNRFYDTWWDENTVLGSMRNGLNPGRFGYFQQVQPPSARPSPSTEKPWAAPGTSFSRSRRSTTIDTSSTCMLFSIGTARDTTHLLHSHRRDYLPCPIWLRLHLPTRLVGLASRNVWHENHRCQCRAFLAASQACLRKTVSASARAEGK